MDLNHSHYFKSVAGLQSVDVYRVLTLFAVTDPCLQHAIKKLLVAGSRGDKATVSTLARDVQEAIDSLKRWQEMRAEDAPVPPSACAPPDGAQGLIRLSPPPLPTMPAHGSSFAPIDLAAKGSGK